MPLMTRDRKHVVNVTLNGQEVSGIAEPRTLLVDFIRHEIGATGTHVGCEHGICGACNIMLDGHVVRACLMLAVQADGREVVTIEGLKDPAGVWHPVQKAFFENFAIQCGFCTPGFFATAIELLGQNPDPTEAEIREYLSGNICRCSGYQAIVEAVRAAAAAMQDHQRG
jgi:aerobic-type carbon monoxide dehydrogenase small subunit (CoxS/CutS family)